MNLDKKYLSLSKKRDRVKKMRIQISSLTKKRNLIIKQISALQRDIVDTICTKDLTGKVFSIGYGNLQLVLVGKRINKYKYEAEFANYCLDDVFFGMFKDEFEPKCFCILFEKTIDDWNNAIDFISKNLESK